MIGLQGAYSGIWIMRPRGLGLLTSSCAGLLPVLACPGWLSSCACRAHPVLITKCITDTQHGVPSEMLTMLMMASASLGSFSQFHRWASSSNCQGLSPQFCYYSIPYQCLKIPENPFFFPTCN